MFADLKTFVGPKFGNRLDLIPLKGIKLFIYRPGKLFDIMEKYFQGEHDAGNKKKI